MRIRTAGASRPHGWRVAKDRSRCVLEPVEQGLIKLIKPVRNKGENGKALRALSMHNCAVPR